MLDYSCGYGSLLRLLGGRDIEPFGYEPSVARGNRAKQPGTTILTTLDQVAERGPFDLFICTEVLEHVPDPRAGLRFFRVHASPEALVAITVPDCEKAYLARAFFRAW
jgi:2-polyprenyl-3-methyl-5-hydroxy-6-metoxy-1,4-benzoquinol methylase